MPFKTGHFFLAIYQLIQFVIRAFAIMASPVASQSLHRSIYMAAMV
jgi:hypothetical protein